MEKYLKNWVTFETNNFLHFSLSFIMETLNLRRNSCIHLLAVALSFSVIQEIRCLFSHRNSSWNNKEGAPAYTSHPTFKAPAQRRSSYTFLTLEIKIWMNFFPSKIHILSVFLREKLLPYFSNNLKTESGSKKLDSYRKFFLELNSLKGEMNI